VGIFPRSILRSFLLVLTAWQSLSCQRSLSKVNLSQEGESIAVRDFSPATPVQLTVGNDANLAPQISVDAKFIAYTTSINGNKEIAIKNMTTKQVSQITFHAADDFSPILNSDGSKIAFVTKRNDAAGDVAIIDASSYRSAIGAESGLIVAEKSLSEELSPVWWESINALLVPSRVSGSNEAVLSLYNYKTNQWQPYGDGKILGSFPSVNRQMNQVAYTRHGRIYINDSSGKNEQELSSLLAGVWARPRFSEAGDELMAVRYREDSNGDGTIDGADNGSVWQIKLSQDLKSVSSQTEFTSTRYNAFFPEQRPSGIFVSLQYRGAIEVFKLPFNGQVNTLWAKENPDQWISEIVNQQDLEFALRSYWAKTLSNSLVSPGVQSVEKSNNAYFRLLEYLERNGSTTEIKLFCADVEMLSKDDEGMKSLCKSIYVVSKNRFDKTGAKRSKVAKSRLSESLVELNKLEKTLKNSKIPLKDSSAFFAIQKAKVLTSLELFDDAQSQLKLAEDSNLTRLQEQSVINQSDVAGKRYGPIEREALLEAALQNKIKSEDLVSEAGSQFVESVNTRNLSNEELTLVRQRVKHIPVLSVLLHELVAKRFLDQKKPKIAAVEYGSLLVSHCKTAPSLILKLSEKFVELAINHLDSEQTEQNMEETDRCLEENREIQQRFRMVRARALVQQSLILMKVREYGQSIKKLRSAVELDKDNLAAWRTLVDALYAKKILSDFRARLKENAESSPNKLSPVYAYGYSLTYNIDDTKSPTAKLKAIDEAIVWMERAKEIEPSVIYPHQTLGWLYLQRGHWSERREQDSSFIGTSLGLWRKIQSVFTDFQDNNLEAAIDSFNTAIFLAEEGSIERANLIQNLGESYHQIENHQKALLNLTERIQMSKTTPFSDQLAEASVFRIAGRSAFQLDELELAVALQRKSVDLWQATGNEAQLALSLDSLALSLRESKKYNEAAVIYKDLQAKYGARNDLAGVARTLSNLGYVYYQDKKYDEAMAAFGESNSRLESENNSKDKKSSDKSQGIAVDVGGQSSASKGFDDFGIRNMNLTFQARILELTGDVGQAEKSYRSKIDLVLSESKKRKKSAKNSLVVEALIAINNLSAMLAENGQTQKTLDEIEKGIIIFDESDLQKSPDGKSHLVELLDPWARTELKLRLFGVERPSSKLIRERIRKEFEESLNVSYANEKSSAQAASIRQRLASLALIDRSQQEIDAWGSAQLKAEAGPSAEKQALGLAAFLSEGQRKRFLELGIMALESSVSVNQVQLESRDPVAGMRLARKHTFGLFDGASLNDEAKSLPPDKFKWQIDFARNDLEESWSELEAMLDAGGQIGDVFEHERVATLSLNLISLYKSEEEKKSQIIRHFRSLTRSRMLALREGSKLQPEKLSKDIGEVLNLLEVLENSRTLSLITTKPPFGDVKVVGLLTGGKAKSQWYEEGSVTKILSKLEVSPSDRIYIACDGPLCDSVMAEIGGKSETLRWSIVSTPEQVLKAQSMDRVATSNAVKWLATEVAPSEGVVAQTGPTTDRDYDWSALTRKEWLASNKKFSDAHLVLVDAFLEASSEKTRGLQLRFNDSSTLSLAKILSGGSSYSTAVLFPNVRLLGSENRMKNYSTLAAWAAALEVPTVLLATSSQTPNENALDFLKKGLEFYNPKNFVVLGTVPASEVESKSVASKKMTEVSELALDASEDGDLPKSKRLFLEALEYARILEDRNQQLTITESLVQTLFKSREWSQAYKYQNKKIQLLKEASAKESDIAAANSTAAVLANRSLQGFLSRKHLVEARAYFEKDEDLLAIARTWHNEALSYESEGDFKATIESYEKSREYFKQDGQNVEAAQKLLDIGNIYRERLSNYPQALEFYGRAIQEFEPIGEKNRIINVQIDRANTLMAMGETRWAINVLERRVLNTIDQKANPVSWARAAQIVANAYFRSGIFDTSQKYIDQIQAAADDIEDSIMRANITIDALNLKGMNLEKLQAREEATKTFESALGISREFKLRGKESMILNNMGFWQREAGDAAGSIEKFKRSLEIDLALKSEADQAYDLRNLAMSLTLLNNLAEAESSAKKALEMSQRLKLAHNEAYSLFALSEIEVKRKQLPAAVKYLEKAEEIAKKASLQDFVWRSSAAIGDIYLQLGDVNKAITFFEQSITTIESLRAGLASTSSKTGFASDRGVQDVYEKLVFSLMKQQMVEKAWQYSERSRARAFIDALATKAQTFGNQVVDDLVESEKRFRSDIEMIERRMVTLLETDPEYASSKIQLAKKVQERQEILQKIEKLAPQVMSLLGVRPFSVEQLTARFTANEAVLQYMVSQKGICYWVIRKGVIKGEIVEVEQSRLTLLIDQYRESLQNFASVDRVTANLSDLLISRPSRQLDGVTHLIIVPHGNLHYLPFASLTLRPGEFLIDRFSVSYLESSEMSRFVFSDSVKSLSSASLAAFANPNSGEPLDLPFAKRELEAITREFRQLISFYGPKATAAAFLEEGAKAEILHFAGHGEFNSIAPSNSRLLFAKNQEVNVEQILSSRFASELIALSACETGLGQLSAGDEMVGFNRAFFFAGAKSIVSSLWRVSDVASSVTVKRFYRGLNDSKSRAEALREAQLVTKRYYNHPAYWSAFKLSGEYR
jgi:CHAT domain-containing protein